MSKTISNTPEDYCPNFNEGKYIDDAIPSTQKTFIESYKYGLKCGCNGKVYEERTKFKNHLNTNQHKNWLELLKKDHENPLKKLLACEKNVKQQQLIIQKYSNEISRLETEISGLKNEIVKLNAKKNRKRNKKRKKLLTVETFEK